MRALRAALALLVALAGSACELPPQEHGAASVPAAATVAISREARSATASAGFRSPRKLDEHFAKHGGEFGDVTREGYLRLAQELRDRPAGGDVLELVRDGDGVVTRFDRASGAFGAYEPDGTIRTFFKPDDGEAYFRRQATRRAGVGRAS